MIAPTTEVSSQILLTLSALLSPEDVEAIRAYGDFRAMEERHRILDIIEGDEFEYDYDYDANDEAIPSITFYTEALIEAIKK